MPKKTIQILHVVFDTNSLFTQVASDLVKNEIKKLILNHKNYPDLKIKWYLPELVVGERKYQMKNKAIDLLPNLHKLEKLMGIHLL
jgi:predicted nucleic acid-binding protein